MIQKFLDVDKNNVLLIIIVSYKGGLDVRTNDDDRDI